MIINSVQPKIDDYAGDARITFNIDYQVTSEADYDHSWQLEVECTARSRIFSGAEAFIDSPLYLDFEPRITLKSDTVLTLNKHNHPMYYPKSHAFVFVVPWKELRFDDHEDYYQFEAQLLPVINNLSNKLKSYVFIQPGLFPSSERDPEVLEDMIQEQRGKLKALEAELAAHNKSNNSNPKPPSIVFGARNNDGAASDED